MAFTLTTTSARAAGHHRVAATAREELHLAGGRAGSQTRPRTGRTASGVLAADGRSNRDISEVLVVSVKTVESHMAKLLAKTGRRRADLAAVAAEIDRSSRQCGDVATPAPDDGA